ncbi:C4-dicarboxylate transporter DcuC [Salipiger mangrovisoli]|uniref:C4-dicarboxylate transporter DcuC n=1 Tax=Salipiger mangrovisoli TaxID=2865933 RepID=A0ABR9X8G3_9RHOB|nr:C4-dicarboxylate transporter DcuC [Salipiger mangrovisoli]MBE9639781.1 C4-dicarboxylate transporter DcuC [Salipiger mangrovisoli]
MLGFIIGLAVTLAAAWLIIKKFQAHTVLLLAGMLLLALTLVVQPETSILYKKSESTGLSLLDIFDYFSDNLAGRIAGLGLIIMSAGGFAKYMNHIGATDAMVNMAIRPLGRLKAPYLVLALGYVVGQVLNIFIPSASGLAMLLLGTFFPTLVRLGVSPAAAATMIGMTSVLDLGPGSANANLAATTADLDVAIYFSQYQVPTALVTIPVIAILTYFTARYFDKRAGHVAEQEANANASTAEKVDVPAFYAMLPLVPLTFILIFSKLLVSWISVSVVTAMFIGALLGLVCEFFRKGDPRQVSKDFMAFFDGMGGMFSRIVSLVVCAEVFAAGLTTIGMVGFMIDLAQGAGFGLTAMTVLMCILVILVTIVTGSGNAAFFSFGHMAPALAGGLGASPVLMLLPMQLIAGLGRSLSPVAGVIIAVSDAGQCSPMEIVRRGAIPLAGGIVAVMLSAVIFT